MRNTAPSPLWKTTGFRAYLGATACTTVAFSMQQLLVSWLLVGVLLLPGDRVGLAQALIGIPGIFIMLWGGASADRIDPRTVLFRAYAIGSIVPLTLVAVDRAGLLDATTVTLWGMAMGVVISFSSPALAAILNRVAGSAVQQGVTASTAVTFFVQIIGLGLAGQLDTLGLDTVLGLQALSIGLGAVVVRRIAPSPASPQQRAVPAWRGVAEGLRATARDRVILAVVSLNFVSSIFNAGAFITVYPFVIKRAYDGNAAMLATMMIVFFAGAGAANLILLRFMPLVHPGRLFLLMQLSRAVVLYLLFIEPDWWLLTLATVAWGLNMGVTSTLARTIVQESAEAEFRGRILSVFTVALIGSAPIGAVILGWIVEAYGTFEALLPSMALSLTLFLVGIFATGIWHYRSPQMDGEDEGEGHGEGDAEGGA